MNEFITQSDVDQYELLFPMLHALYKEIQELSKKKPDSPLNPYKVKAINRVLEPLKELFKNESTYDFLDILDTEILPTNSDVVLILPQYQKALELFRTRYYSPSNREWKIKKPEPQPQKRKRSSSPD